MQKRAERVMHFWTFQLFQPHWGKKSQLLLFGIFQFRVRLWLVWALLPLNVSAPCLNIAYMTPVFCICLPFHFVFSDIIFVFLPASKCVRPMSQYLPHDPCMASTLLKCPAIASVTERIPCIFGGYYSPTNWCPNICNATQGGRSQGTDLIDNLQKTVLSDQRRHSMFRCFSD